MPNTHRAQSFRIVVAPRSSTNSNLAPPNRIHHAKKLTSRPQKQSIKVEPVRCVRVHPMKRLDGWICHPDGLPIQQVCGTLNRVIHSRAARDLESKKSV